MSDKRGDRIADLNRRLDAFRADCCPTCAALRAEIDRLRPYIRHLPGCLPTYQFGLEAWYGCTCGLEGVFQK